MKVYCYDCRRCHWEVKTSTLGDLPVECPNCKTIHPWSYVGQFEMDMAEEQMSLPMNFGLNDQEMKDEVLGIVNRMIDERISFIKHYQRKMDRCQTAHSLEHYRRREFDERQKATLLQDLKKEIQDL